VLGDVSPEALGRCDYHEHLFQVSPLLPGDELDDEEASAAEAASLRLAGVDAMVEATPTGLGRDPAAVARISAATGLAVVHVTGAHRSEHYAEGHWLTAATEDDLVARFTADVVDGLPAEDSPGRSPWATGPDGTSVRAGMVKTGVGYWRIDPFERRVLAAAAATAGAVGVPVMVHLEHGSAAWEVLDALAAGGLAADRVVLAHADRNLDPGLHAELTLAGAYLGFDGMARHREAPDAAILDCLERVAATGDRHRLLLGGDVARRSRYRAYGGIPGLDYLPTRFLPRVRERMGADVLDLLLITNPARLLTLSH
jgi:predicted metal-dependent phosphotriesterase family hydrolase